MDAVVILFVKIADAEFYADRISDISPSFSHKKSIRLSIIYGISAKTCGLLFYYNGVKLLRQVKKSPQRVHHGNENAVETGIGGKKVQKH